jgi:hypothetical protein
MKLMGINLEVILRAIGP